MNSGRRVVITGAGVVSSIGVGLDAFWPACLQGQSVVKPIPAKWREYCSFKSHLWAPLHEIQDDRLTIARAERLRTDRGSIYALAAVREALEQAQLDPTPKKDQPNVFSLKGADPARMGAYLGTGIGGAHTFLQNHCFHLLQRPR